MNKNVYTGKYFEVRRHKKMHARRCRNKIDAIRSGRQCWIDSNNILPKICEILNENHDKVLVRGRGGFYWFKSFYLGKEAKSLEIANEAACVIVERLARAIGPDCQILFTKNGVSIAPLSASGDLTAETLYDALKEAEMNFANE